MSNLFSDVIHEAESAPRWPAAIALLLVGVSYMFLPRELIFGPRWLLLVLSIVMLLIFWLARYLGHQRLARWSSFLSIGLVTLALLVSTVFLTQQIQTDQIPAEELLRDAIILWSINILTFAIWYWELDGGGPAHRKLHKHVVRDLLFPQMTRDGIASKNWAPNFIDYLFVAFNSSTAFSPSDTLVLSRRIKLLMMLQTIISMTIILVLASRAVSML
jgi:hypothetical protein